MKLIVAALFVATTASACGSDEPTLRQQEETCFLAAAEAYPSWDASQGNVLDVIPECKDLPENVRQRLRNVMTEVVISATARQDKEN